MQRNICNASSFRFSFTSSDSTVYKKFQFIVWFQCVIRLAHIEYMTFIQFSFFKSSWLWSWSSSHLYALLKHRTKRILLLLIAQSYQKLLLFCHFLKVIAQSWNENLNHGEFLMDWFYFRNTVIESEMEGRSKTIQSSLFLKTCNWKWICHLLFQSWIAHTLRMFSLRLSWNHLII